MHSKLTFNILSLCSIIPCKQEDFPAYQTEDSIPSSSPSPPQETDEESDENRKDGRGSGREWDSKREGERENGERFHVDKEAKSPIRKANQRDTEAISSRFVRTPTEISQEVLNVSKSESKKKITEERKISRSGVTNFTDQNLSNATNHEDEDEGKYGAKNHGRDAGKSGITDSRPSSSSRSSRKAAAAIADAAKMVENSAKLG